jgi:prepilin-type N-terminal cleavage/methylation domain-containing protein/prepilin-type processing-associated H-X9-DG protein
MKRAAFTLIELLVVMAIVAILAAILFPVFALAKTSAKKTANVSNLRQLAMGVQMYAMDNEGYPMMSSPSSFNPRTRWPDYIFPYVRSEDMFRGPLAPKEMFTKKFAHNPLKAYGGYGYNYQYLGNSRALLGNPNLPFTAPEASIEAPSETIAISDTRGVRNSLGKLAAGEYTIDPPLPSAIGSGKSSGFYGDGAECSTGIWACRSTPAEWHVKRTSIAWCDGHATSMRLNQLDDYDKNGVWDNGFWNGRADPAEL